MIPQWFDDAKFGIMVVWTPASIPAFAPPWAFGDDIPDAETIMRELPAAEMYLNTMLLPGSSTERHHMTNYGDKPYDHFVAEFRELITHWTPARWADLLARSGAKYSVLVVKHQDGFLLWPSDTKPGKPDWHAERDVVGEFADALRGNGMRFGALYTGGVDHTFGGLPLTEDMAANNEQDSGLAAHVDAQWRELIERYRPEIVWNDMGYPPEADPAALVGWYREQVPDGVVNDRFARSAVESDSELGDFVTLEYDNDYANSAPADQKWESTRGMGTSFGYNRMETEDHYNSSTELIHELVDCVARGGNLLLAVGPTATGDIPWPQARRLLEIGWWLREHGHAIYGSRPWTRAAGVTADGLDIRYTRTNDAINAILLGTPAQSYVDLDVRLDSGAEVTAGGEPLPWAETAHGLRVVLPETPHEQPAFTLRLSPASAVSG